MQTRYIRYGSSHYRNRWQDWAILALSVWLFISPWVLDFGSGVTPPAGPISDAGHAAWNAWVLGVVVFLFAVSEIIRMEILQEWIILVLGAWIFAAPWALSFTELIPASWDHWLVGGAVIVIAVWNMTEPQRQQRGPRPVPSEARPSDRSP